MNHLYSDPVDFSETEDFVNDSLQAQFAIQQYEIQVMAETLKAGLTLLQQQPRVTDYQKQLLAIQQCLLLLDENTKNIQESLIVVSVKTQNSIDYLRQDIEVLAKTHRQIKSQLDDQQKMFNGHLSIKIMVLQFLLIGLMAAAGTVVALKIFLPVVQLVAPTVDVNIKKFK